MTSGDMSGLITDSGVPDDPASLTTVYNGSSLCQGCGTVLDPITTMYTRPAPMCVSCRRTKAAKHVKRMFSS